MSMFDRLGHGKQDEGPGQDNLDSLKQQSLQEVEHYWEEVRREALHRLNMELAQMLADGKSKVVKRFSDLGKTLSEAGEKHEAASVQDARAIVVENREEDVKKVTDAMRDKLKRLQLID